MNNKDTELEASLQHKRNIIKLPIFIDIDLGMPMRNNWQTKGKMDKNGHKE